MVIQSYSQSLTKSDHRREGKTRLDPLSHERKEDMLMSTNTQGKRRLTLERKRDICRSHKVITLIHKAYTYTVANTNPSNLPGERKRRLGPLSLEVC